MMNDLIIYFLIALIFSSIGLFIGNLLAKLNFEKEKTVVEKEKSTLEERVALLQQSKDMVENNYIELQKELKSNSTNKMNRITISWNKYQMFLQTLLMLELLLEPLLQS